MNDPSRSSIDCLGIFENYREKQYDLYYYNENAIGERFLGEKVSEKIVEKAREALKIYQTEMDEFQSKILATKRDSNEAYMKMMEELDDQKSSEELTKLSQVQTDLKTGTILESSNYNFEQAQSDIKSKLVKNSESMEKVQTDLKRFSETILESTNHNLELAQADIKSKLAENSESIEKVQTDLKRFSETILESTNHNLEIAQADIKAKLAENKENIEKVQTDLKRFSETILESLKELSTLQSKK